MWRSLWISLEPWAVALQIGSADRTRPAAASFAWWSLPWGHRGRPSGGQVSGKNLLPRPWEIEGAGAGPQWSSTGGTTTITALVHTLCRPSFRSCVSPESTFAASGRVGHVLPPPVLW